MDERTSKRADPGAPSVFSGIVDAAKGKRRGSVDGMEMRVGARRAEAGDGDGGGGGGGGGDTLQLAESTAEQSRGVYMREAEEKRGGKKRREEQKREERRREKARRARFSHQPNKRPLRPMHKSHAAVFAPLVQVYIYGVIPLPVVTGTGLLVCRCASGRHR